MKRAIAEPRKVPKYLIRRFVKRDYGVSHRYLDADEYEFLTWDSDLEWGTPSAEVVSAGNYWMYKTMDSLVSKEYENALELGCGWGNITSWLSEFATNTHGVDLNGEVLDKGRKHYPHIEFVQGIGQQLPFQSDSFDLILTLTALQHIPDASIDEVASEIQRVAEDGATVLIKEDFEKPDKEVAIRSGWPRTKREYEELFDECRIVDDTKGEEGTIDSKRDMIKMRYEEQ